MALVEVARFLDLNEAQVAASALRASDIPVHIAGERLGEVAYHLQMAMGGFALWAPERDASAAREFIATARAAPSPLAPLNGGKIVAKLSLSLIFTAILGAPAPANLRWFSRLSDDSGE